MKKSVEQKLQKILSLFNLVMAKNNPRHTIRFAKRHFKGKSITVAEIGVYEGKHAKSMFRHLNISKFYGIDPYEEYEDFNDSNEVIPANQKALINAKKAAQKRLSKHIKKITFIKKYSHDAVNHIPKVDLVYIDGNHNYDYFKKDLENYYKKVREGGILAGHDITHAKFNRDIFFALAEFCVKKGVRPHITRTDWWFVKK